MKELLLAHRIALAMNIVVYLVVGPLFGLLVQWLTLWLLG